MESIFDINDILELKSFMIGDEAIAWQKTSKVGEKMVALFDKCKAYRKKHFIPEKNNWRIVATDIGDILRKELIPIWKNELGLNIKELNLNTNEPSGFVAIDPYTREDLEAAWLSGKRSEGEVSNENIPVKYINRIKELTNKAKSLDLIEGKLKGKTWNIVLYVDVTLFFFYDLFCSKKDLNDKNLEHEFTSREIAAVLLHEAGHAMFIIEKIAYGYSVQLMITDLVNGFIKSKPGIEDIREFYVSIIGPVFDTIIANENVYKDTMNTDQIKILRNICNTIVSFCDYVIAIKEKVKTKFTPGYEDPEMIKINTVAPSEDSDYEYTDNDSVFMYGLVLINSLMNFVLVMITTFSIPILSLTKIHRYGLESTIFILLNLCIKIINDVPGELVGDDGKSSDLKTTSHNVYLNERSADEHTIRHGFGGELASGLVKLRLLFNKGFATQNTYIKNSKLILTINTLSVAIRRLTANQDCFYSYEWDDMRIRRICQNCIAFFKNAKVSPQYRDNMLITLKRAMDNLDILGRDIYNRNKINMVIKTIRLLTQPAELVRILTSGRLTQEYEQHLNQLENLSNNLMFVHKHQFDKIAQNMKSGKKIT